MERGYVEMLSACMVKVTIATCLAVAAVYSLIGPLGSYSVAKLLDRWAYGVLCAVEGWPVHYSLTVVTLYLLRSRKPAEALAGVVTAALIVALPNTAWTLMIDRLVIRTLPTELGPLEVYLLVASTTVVCSVLYFYVMWLRIRHGRSATDAGRGRAAPADAAAEPLGTTDTGEDKTEQHRSEPNYPSPAIAPDGASAEAQAETADSQVQPGDEMPAAEQRPADPRELALHRPAWRVGTVLQLLPDRLGTDLVYIKSEDHYLQVHTTVGSSLIKMRFSDAVAGLGDRGIQVHRSYWVATRHVTKAVRSGKRTLLRLTGDHKVPVSVTHVHAVRALLAR